LRRRQWVSPPWGSEGGVDTRRRPWSYNTVLLRQAVGCGGQQKRTARKKRESWATREYRRGHYRVPHPLARVGPHQRDLGAARRANVDLVKAHMAMQNIIPPEPVRSRPTGSRRAAASQLAAVVVVLLRKGGECSLYGGTVRQQIVRGAGERRGDCRDNSNRYMVTAYPHAYRYRVRSTAVDGTASSWPSGTPTVDLSTSQY
jgi:hypothetical protein